jgi:glycerol uptake facilitator protein
MENDRLKFEHTPSGQKTTKPLPGAKKCAGLLALFKYEMFGTAMLVYSVNMIAPKQPGSGFWGIPLTLFGTLCWAGPVTGGHMNPAVSLAVLIQNISKIGENIVLFLVMVAA